VVEMKEKINSAINQSMECKKYVQGNLVPEIEQAINILLYCYRNNKKLLICGNGGSAADAQHMVGELVGKFKMERKPLACVGLTTNTSILTAWSNDYSYDTVFERQVQALGQKEDVLLGISTSGNSENVIKAIESAKQIGMKTITLLGKDGGRMKDMGDLNIIVGSNDTPRIQEAHIMIIHIICEILESELFGSVCE